MSMDDGVLAVEKRQYPRVPLEITVKFRRLAKDERDEAVKSMHKAMTKDLSKGGIALVEASGLARGDLLKVELELPGRDRAVKAYSEVMWIKPPDAGMDSRLEICGIKFMGLRPEDEDYLDNVVADALGGSGDEDTSEAAELDREKEFMQKMSQRFKR